MRTIADLKAVGEWCGYRSHERMILLRSKVENFKRSPERERSENIFYISSDRLDDEHLSLILESIFMLRPKIVFGYSSTLTTINGHLERHPEINMRHSGVEILLVGAEGIDPLVGKALSEKFACPLYRRYSDMEAGILSQDMGGNIPYEWNWASFYLEVLKLDSDESVADGELGRIVITDLFNKAMPLIRYDTGDLGVLDLSAGKPRLSDVYCRRVDSIFDTNGGRVSPHAITNSFWGIEGLLQWQFVQIGPKSYEFVANASAGSAVNEDDIKARIRASVGKDAEVTIRLVDEIPILHSGKRRYIEQKYYR